MTDLEILERAKEIIEAMPCDVVTDIIGQSHGALVDNLEALSLAMLRGEIE